MNLVATPSIHSVAKMTFNFPQLKLADKHCGSLSWIVMPTASDSLLFLTTIYQSFDIPRFFAFLEVCGAKIMISPVGVHSKLFLRETLKGGVC